MPIAPAALRLAVAVAGFLLVTTTSTAASPAPKGSTHHPSSEVVAAAPAAWSPPLSTQGRYIVDSQGNRFRLKGANWDGAQGSWTGSGSIGDPANHHAGQDSHGIPLGLDRVPLDQLLNDFHQLGLNTIRLPFSNAMIHNTTPVPDSAVTANPRLRGRTPLQIYDAVVDALSAGGFAVILNNHTNTSRWCCGIDGNERWNSSQSAQAWADDWVFMARRYASVPRVVGADLYNEVRRDVLDDPNWGLGDDHDWYAAARLAADRILTEANPRLLIVVEGINWTGIPADGLPHGRPVLTPAGTLSHTLVDAHKLVYSAHFYGYTGPHHSGATGVGETHDPRYQDLSRDDLYTALHDEAFFVEEPDRHYTAPVWVSEFGIGAGETSPAARTWFGSITDYFAGHDTDFAFWPLVGFAGHDDWALLQYDETGHRSGILDAGDWHAAAWQHLMTAPSETGPVAAVPVWRMLAIDHGDAVESVRVRATGDWDPGAYKATCPDGLRLIGLGHTSGRGLCTDSTGGGPGDPRAAAGGQTVVTDERYVPASGDWASGYAKLQCPEGSFLVGYSARGERVSAALCVPARNPLAGAGRTVWFDRSDNRPTGAAGGDFVYGDYKGQCGDDEYAAGIAYTTRVGSRPGPDALLCRRLP
ncbi:glycoside hydrolase [Streptomyces sp. IMTB 2501]|uniref:glycoside hydrolase family 5 protein n=1 Tax=Streptomyces sp. IMTB 2501 TaxID=1776340 RepID=UPI00096E5CF9|nr:cellulase family glycosylhydrolase [Streptomyces sp. IMTB 2501]OLZ74643.1 glycoside hydrolase [Streptomyces sp. IMTB 2501]